MDKLLRGPLVYFVKKSYIKGILWIILILSAISINIFIAVLLWLFSGWLGSRNKTEPINSITMKPASSQQKMPSPIQEDIVSSTSSNAKEPKNNKHYTFNIAGITKKNDKGEDIQKLLKSLVNEELEYSEAYKGLTNKEILEDYYGERVYQVEIENNCGIDFVFEPNNPYDPNAIKVFHCQLGHIGYVPRDENVKVGRIIKDKDYDIAWMLVGGKYKYVDDDDKVITEKNTYGIKIELSYREAGN